MKLLIVFAFLALVATTQSAPISSSTTRELILPDYHEYEIDLSDDETNTTTTTTRRSTYVFSTKIRNTLPSRGPWLTWRTSSMKTTTISEADIDEQDGFKHFRNIREFFKKLLEDFKKFIRNITGYDIIKAIQQFFNKNSDH